MALHWSHCVRPQCDFCDLRPTHLHRPSWEEAASAAKAAGWIVEEASGECMCPDCLGLASDLPAVHPDTVVQLADPLPRKGGEA
jgi:hypothetical protein